MISLTRITVSSLLSRCSCRCPSKSYLLPLPPQVKRNASTLADRVRAIPPNNYLMLAFPCISFYLGVWQIKRRKWKLGLIEELESKRMMPGVDIPLDLLEITSDREYESFRMHGEFDHSRETYIGPRTLLDYSASAGGLISSGNTIGVHVVTPFKLSGRQEEVLVSRGWVSRKQHREGDIHRPNGEQLIEAVYRVPEKGSSQSTYDKRTNMWAKRNIKAIADSLDTSLYFFDMKCTLPPAQESNSPVPEQTNVQLRNEHMSYILTWFSLTALMLLIWCNKHLRSQSGYRGVHSLVSRAKRDGFK